MVDGVNQQPGLFQRIGNFFGAGDPSAGQRIGTPFFPDDPNASQPTDPFAGLSRSQRTMLGFAALRDAAASLEGRDSNFFQSALGGFEQARERERLRAQGQMQNQVQALQALAQIQALNQISGGNPATQQLEAALMAQLGMDGGMVMPAGGAAAPIAAPAPSVAAPSVAAPAVRPATGPNIMDAQGNVVGYIDDQGREVMLPVGGAPVEPAAPVDDMAALDQREAEIIAEIERLSRASSVAGVTAPTRGLELELARIGDQRERLAAEQEAAEAAETARLAGEDEARQAGYYVNLIESVMEDPALEGVLGRIEGRVDPRGMGGAALFNEAEMNVLGQLDQLGGAAFLEAFQMLRGGGQITQIEGEKATQAITRLGQRAVSPEAYRAALDELRQVYANAQARARGEELPFPEINVERAAPAAGAATHRYNPATGQIEAIQ